MIHYKQLAISIGSVFFRKVVDVRRGGVCGTSLFCLFAGFQKLCCTYYTDDCVGTIMNNGKNEKLEEQ